MIQNLLTRKQRDSSSDFGALYLRYQPAIYRYLVYRTGNAQTAEDLTADVFLKMVQILSAQPVEMQFIQAWLFQVARNLAIDHYRRTAAHPSVALAEDLEEVGANLSRTVDLNLTSAALAQALTQLDEMQRDVLLLRFIEALPIAETARVMHKSEDAVKGLQRRALLSLRKYLEHEEIEHV